MHIVDKTTYTLPQHFVVFDVLFFFNLF